MGSRVATLSPFGLLVRRWRATRGMSQLALAAAAGTTPRHVSFLETGRSRPGPDLVLRIADALGVPLLDRNALLAAAGLAAEFPEYDLGSAELAAVDAVLDQVLARHEPFPAWVVRRPLTFLRANTAARSLFPGLTDLPVEALVDLWFGPGPFREMVQNWQDVVQTGLSALRRHAVSSGDPQAVVLLRRAEDVSGRPARRLGPAPERGTGYSPVVCPVFTLGGRTVRTISAVMSFDTAVEVTTSQLRIELMFPADAQAAAFFDDLARRGPRG